LPIESTSYQSLNPGSGYFPVAHISPTQTLHVSCCPCISIAEQKSPLKWTIKR